MNSICIVGNWKKPVLKVPTTQNKYSFSIAVNQQTYGTHTDWFNNIWVSALKAAYLDKV